MKLIPASKKFNGRPSSSSLFEQPNPNLVLRVFVTLFNLQGARRSSAGFNFTTLKLVCQELFQILFNLFLRGPLAFQRRFLILAHLIRFVKNFFRVFSSSFVLSSAVLCARRLSATLICYHIFLALSRTFFELLSRFQSPQLRFPCDNHTSNPPAFFSKALS